MKGVNSLVTTLTFLAAICDVPTTFPSPSTTSIPSFSSCLLIRKALNEDAAPKKGSETQSKKVKDMGPVVIIMVYSRRKNLQTYEKPEPRDLGEPQDPYM